MHIFKIYKQKSVCARPLESTMKYLNINECEWLPFLIYCFSVFVFSLCYFSRNQVSAMLAWRSVLSEDVGFCVPSIIGCHTRVHYIIHYFIIFYFWWRAQNTLIIIASEHTHKMSLFFPSSSCESYVKLGFVHSFIISRLFLFRFFIYIQIRFYFLLLFPATVSILKHLKDLRSETH